MIGLGFLHSISYIKSILSHEKVFAVGKSGPNATFNLIFPGLGWPWVGEFDGFIIIFTCFPTIQNLVYRKQPYLHSILGLDFYVNIPPQWHRRDMPILPPSVPNYLTYSMSPKPVYPRHLYNSAISHEELHVRRWLTPSP